MSKLLDYHSEAEIRELIQRAQESTNFCDRLCDKDKIIGYLKDCERYYKLVNRLISSTPELEYGVGGSTFVTGFKMSPDELDKLKSDDDINECITTLSAMSPEYEIVRRVVTNITKSPLFPLLGKIVVVEFPNGSVYRGKLVHDYGEYATFWAVKPITKANKLSKTIRTIYDETTVSVRLAEGDEAYYEER